MKKFIFPGESSADKALLRLAGIKAGKALIGPEAVGIHITDHCNLTCRFCIFHARCQPGRVRKPGFMSFAQFKQVAQDCADLKVESIELSGAGEPTLHPRFADMVELLREKDFYVSLLTNATFPLKQMASVLKTDCLRVNLGASDRERYQAIHGADLFDRVTDNLRALVDRRKKVRPGLKIGVVFVANKLNADDESAVRALASRIGVDHFRTAVVETNTHSRKLALASRGQAGVKPPSGWFPCFYGWYYAVVKTGGRISLCCYAGQEVKNLGKVTFKEAWGSEAFARVRREMKFGTFQKAHPKCRTCPNLEQNRVIARTLARMEP